MWERKGSEGDFKELITAECGREWGFGSQSRRRQSRRLAYVWSMDDDVHGDLIRVMNVWRTTCTQSDRIVYISSLLAPAAVMSMSAEGQSQSQAFRAGCPKSLGAVGTREHLCSTPISFMQRDLREREDISHILLILTVSKIRWSSAIIGS